MVIFVFRKFKPKNMNTYTSANILKSINMIENPYGSSRSLKFWQRSGGQNPSNSYNNNSHIGNIRNTRNNRRNKRSGKTDNNTDDNTSNNICNNTDDNTCCNNTCNNCCNNTCNNCDCTDIVFASVFLCILIMYIR